MSSDEREMKIEVKADDSVASGTFVNFSHASHTAEEFVLDFLFIHPSPPKGFGKLMSRIIMTPGHAKRLSNLLSDTIRRYEEQFGEIHEPQLSVNVDNLQ